MAKEKMQMEVGKRYKGYGVLNEYGEYLFTPCQKLEPSEKNMKIVRSNGSATLYESKNNFRLSVNVPKNIGERHFVEARRGIQRVREDVALSDAIQPKEVSVLGFERMLVPLTKGFNAIDVVYE